MPATLHPLPLVNQNHLTHPVYAAQNFCTASTLVAMYEDDAIFQSAAADFLTGKIGARGTVPVSVCNIKYGNAIQVAAIRGVNIFTVGTDNNMGGRIFAFKVSG